jgi:hypothetical protein
VGAVGGAEGVVDVQVAELGELGCEGGVVGLLACVEAQIFEQRDAAGLQRVDHRRGVRPDAVGGEDDGLLKQPGQRLDHRAQAHAVDALALGTVEVGEQHRLGACDGQRADRRQR